MTRLLSLNGERIDKDTYCPDQNDECKNMRRQQIRCVLAKSVVALAAICVERDINLESKVEEAAPAQE